MNRSAFRIVLVLVVAGLVVLSCEEPTTPNQSPTITALNLPAEVDATVDAAFDCVATDPDSTTLAYSWTCSAGELQSTTGSTVVWTAPDSSGTASVTVIVADDSGAADTATGTVTVKPVTNTLIDWTGEVAGGDAQLWTIPRITAGYTVFGSFSAQPHGITFLVLDSANYASWRFNQSFTAVVRVDSSTGSSFSAVIPASVSYNFVLDNIANPAPDSVQILVQTTSP